MNDDQLIYCIIAIAIGWLFAKQMGNGFSVGANTSCNNAVTKQCSGTSSEADCYQCASKNQQILKSAGCTDPDIKARCDRMNTITCNDVKLVIRGESSKAGIALNRCFDPV